MPTLFCMRSTDALLGTIAAGDIGTHFPPSDMTFKNMDSAIFLRKALELVTAQARNDHSHRHHYTR